MTEDEIKIENAVAIGRMALRVARDKRDWDREAIDRDRRKLTATLAVINGER